ncbi:cadherin-23-like [Ylistrum balloti]|uniref:cadherin-23-like n=1 Tax=Ylistrum balloti TaxID=509963 RepID=UPI002905805E|nr:cadherin-23-like [Ylistrum balloti]
MTSSYSGCTPGPSDVTLYISTLPGTTGEQVIVTDPAADAGCCGFLKRATFYPRDTGYIQFQLWRPLTLNEYMLISEYRYYVPSKDTTLTLTFPIDIYVENGDCLGWYTENTGIIPYSSGSYDNNIVISIGDVAVGYNYSLSTPHVNNRIYAIEFTITDGSKPDFTNLPATVDVYDDSPSGVTLYTTSVTDADVEDIPTLYMTFQSVSPSTANIAFDTTTGEFTTTGTLSFGTIIVNVRVDDRCGRSNTRALTINVLNHAPVIDNLPASGDLSEVVTLETFLYHVTVSDASGDPVTCTLNDTSPSGAPFLLKYISGTSSYGIYSQSSPNLDFNTNSLYTLTIHCTDGMGTDSETFTVHVTENSPAVFSNLPANVTLPLTTPLGTIVYTVEATDPEGNSLIYYTYGCSRCWFQMASSGEVIVDESLLTKTSATYNVNIRVSDGLIDSSSSTLTFIFTGLNSQPTLDNLPRTLNIPESLPIGAEVFTLVMTDPDVTDTHSYIFSYNPASATSAFAFDTSSRQLTVASILNYESGVTQYTISFTVDDGHLSDGPEDLIINILDVNDAPVFQKSIYTVTEYERGINYVLPDPGFLVTDDDPGDTVTYAITSGNSLGRFKMNATTGILKFMVSYDIDNNNMPAFVDLIVTATDSGGLTATVLLEVTVLDNNDNSPVWEQDSYETTIMSDMVVGSSILQVQATDIDVEYTNNNIIYTVFSGSTEYFGIKDNGEIYLLKSVSIYGNYTELDVVIRATSPGRTANVPVKVIINPPTYYNFFDDTGNVAWFSVCIAIGVVAVAVSSFLLYRYFRYGYVCSKKTTDTSIEHVNLENNESNKGRITVKETVSKTEDLVKGISPSNSTDQLEQIPRNITPVNVPPRYDSLAMNQGIRLVTNDQPA